MSQKLKSNFKSRVIKGTSFNSALTTHLVYASLLAGATYAVTDKFIFSVEVAVVSVATISFVASRIKTPSKSSQFKMKTALGLALSASTFFATNNVGLALSAFLSPFVLFMKKKEYEVEIQAPKGIYKHKSMITINNIPHTVYIGNHHVLAMNSKESNRSFVLCTVDENVGLKSETKNFTLEEMEGMI